METNVKLDLDDIIQSVMKHKLHRYIAGRIDSEIARQHHKKTNKKIKENEGGEAPTNAMGHSSSVSGTGNIDTFDPLLKMKVARRKPPQQMGTSHGTK